MTDDFKLTKEEEEYLDRWLAPKEGDCGGTLRAFNMNNLEEELKDIEPILCVQPKPSKWVQMEFDFVNEIDN